MSSIYTEKWVLFLDILGFEAYVGDDKKSEEFANIILPLFDDIVKGFSERYKIFESDMKISQFSDTFVISCSDRLLFLFFAIVSSIQFNLLLEANLLSRGAITYGNVFHNGSQFIGPAITRAYNLEKSEAIYPRVIIDPKCEERCGEKLLTVEKKKKFLAEDYDGYWYIPLKIKDLDVGWSGNSLKFTTIVDALYEQHKNTKHRGKYTWLKQKADEFLITK